MDNGVIELEDSNIKSALCTGSWLCASSNRLGCSLNLLVFATQWPLVTIRGQDS